MLQTLPSGSSCSSFLSKICIPFFNICILQATHVISPCYNYTVRLQMHVAVSKVNKKFISHLTWAKRTPSAVATVQVLHLLQAVRFSCLLRRHFPRWRRSRKRLSVCSVLSCPNMWLQCDVQCGARFRKDAPQPLHTTIAYVPQRTSLSDNACTEDN